jgi:hypothetical protein
MTFLLFTTHIPVCIYRVYSVCKKNGTSFGEALIQLAPFGCIAGASYAWLASGSLALEEHVVLFCMTVGIVFADIATKIILAHLLKREFPMFNWGLVPLVVGAILANAKLFNLYVTGVNYRGMAFTTSLEGIYIWIYLVMAIVSFVSHCNVSTYTTNSMNTKKGHLSLYEKR